MSLSGGSEGGVGGDALVGPLCFVAFARGRV